MSASHRICETCVYCSFAGNCDRYDKPLTSIEQPACDVYEIHPLLAENAKLREERDTYRDLVECMVHPDIPDQLQAENAKLRELVRDAYAYYYAAYYSGVGDEDIDKQNIEEIERRMRELGIEDAS